MNKTILVLISAILLISTVSASFLDNSNLHITLNKDNSEAVFQLEDTTGTDYDRVDVSFSCSDGELSLGEGLPDFLNDMLSSSSSDFCSLISPVTENGTFSFYISDFVNGVNFRADFNDGQTSPVFSNVSIIDIPFEINFEHNGIPMSIFPSLGNILENYTDYTLADLNSPTLFLTNLIKDSSTNTEPMQGHASLTKTGNTYTFNYEKGFGENTEEYLTEIEKYVTLYAKNTFSLTNLVDIPSELLAYSDFDYDVSIDLSELRLVNDEEQVITVTLSSGETIIGTKEVFLTLTGLPLYNTAPYVPQDLDVRDWISQITNLPLGSSVLGITISDILPVPSGINIHALKIIIIDVNNPDAEGYIYFSVDKNSVSNPAEVSLYVLNEITNLWEIVPTDYTPLSDTETDYTYVANTLHFSTFMIGEDVTPTPIIIDTEESENQDSGTVDSETPSENEVTTNLGEEDTTSNIDNTPAPITGGIIGALTSTGGIIVLAFLVGITATAVTLRAVKKRKK